MRQTIWREFTLAFWDVWERIYSLLFHARKLQPGSLFRLNLREYRGPVLTLRDGTALHPGDMVGELHLANRQLLELQQKCGNQIQAVMCVKKELKQSLSQLATLVAQGKVDPQVKAFFGITIFHQGARLLGFEVEEIRSRFWRFCFRCGQLLLLATYHPLGFRRFQKGHQSLVPKVIWMSRSQLIRNFSPPERP
ncbi:MAG: hypothetical protein PWQ99_23 [Clostridia bacterium]|jgi:hypothetical protein|uniref:YkoP-like domain-containing protein n=1 Tax=Thermacetogenium phaeum TaxID=85874 RepID=A0A101FGX9_9THEO|nr:MAG: Uncharacterized protein XD66_0459 [Thermacetogenium phaeum]MDK2880248.1 hypothetical protein [Clostridia bacterium]